MLGLRSAIENATTPEELAAAIAAAGSSPRWMASSLGEVAEFFGVATSTVTGWRMESPPMPGSDGSWPLDAITRWRHQKITGSDLATAQKQATLEATQLAIDARRLELSKERGELVELADVERFVATALIECRVVVMSIAEAIATSAPPELRDHARTEADRTCRSALTSLRRRLELAELDQERSTNGHDIPEQLTAVSAATGLAIRVGATNGRQPLDDLPRFPTRR